MKLAYRDRTAPHRAALPHHPAFSGDFVERVFATANEAMERKYDLESRGFTLDKVAARVAEVLGMKPEDVWAVGRYRHIVEARSLLCYWAVRELGITMSSLARKLNFSSGCQQISKSRREAGKG